MIEAKREKKSNSGIDSICTNGGPHLCFLLISPSFSAGIAAGHKQKGSLFFLQRTNTHEFCKNIFALENLEGILFSYVLPTIIEEERRERC
ncbi:hypothetical protein GUJ93_ZPchr0012g20504 [Zizania palustris]|uniref:Uncharacterized protein n=1 Tax=Zizania palustris TaxID=103762 RepID=A0A8J5WQP4_ZIZPA|nr:hypothetical protein GUJ93_ZPchr0012g20504 [Zizania palustris]